MEIQRLECGRLTKLTDTLHKRAQRKHTCVFHQGGSFYRCSDDGLAARWAAFVCHVRFEYSSWEEGPAQDRQRAWLGHSGTCRHQVNTCPRNMSTDQLHSWFFTIARKSRNWLTSLSLCLFLRLGQVLALLGTRVPLKQLSLASWLMVQRGICLSVSALWCPYLYVCLTAYFKHT